VYSAAKAFRFMTKKDRLLLLHFIFLFISLLCKTLSLLLGAMYYQEYEQNNTEWVQIYIFVENMGYLSFFIACSLNLIKWILLQIRIDLYVNKQTAQQFEQKKKFSFGVSIASLTLISIAELVLISIDTSIKNDHEALDIDRALNMIYALNGVILAALFIFIGIRLLRKLNHHYEDIYEEQKASIRFGLITVSLSLILISARFVY